MDTRKLMVQAIREANRKGCNPYDSQPAYAREFEKVWKRAAGMAARRAAEERAKYEEACDEQAELHYSTPNFT